MWKFSTIFAGGLIALSISTHTHAAQLDIQGPRVVRAAIPTDFIVTDRFIRYGVVASDGSCTFKTSMHLSPNQGSLYEIEVAYDQDTCRSLVVQGNYKNGKATDRGGGDQPGMRHEQSSSKSVGSPTDSSAPVYWASYDTWLRDPIYLTLNEVISKITYQPISGCASGDYVNFAPDYYWLSETGWYVASKNSFPSFDCSSVSLDSVGTFASPASYFPACQPSGVEAIYNSNIVAGDAVGGADGSSEITRVGPASSCTNLWTEEKRLLNGQSKPILISGDLGCPESPPALFFQSDIPIAEGNFYTTSSGTDYNGTPLYFAIAGTLSVEQPNVNLDAYVSIYYDPAFTELVREDECKGPVVNGQFEDDSCVLVENVDAGCVPIYMQLTASSENAISAVPRYLRKQNEGNGLQSLSRRR